MKVGSKKFTVFLEDVFFSRNKKTYLFLLFLLVFGISEQSLFAQAVGAGMQDPFLGMRTIFDTIMKGSLGYVIACILVILGVVTFIKHDPLKAVGFWCVAIAIIGYNKFYDMLHSIAN